MTYEEQQKIEKLNKEIINTVISNVKAADFINYYINHNQKETCERFGIRNNKQLIKILKIFNYDFSTKKPSKFKGKKSPRSHESYMTGGAKSAETQRNSWKNKTEEELKEYSKMQKIAHSTDEFKNKIKLANKKYYESLSEEERQTIRMNRQLANKATWKISGKEILQKTYETKKSNHTFNSSKPEDSYYIHLIDIYGKDDVVRQYRDDRYPYACDFYVKSLDLFIELNFNWTHGGHPFDSQNEADIKKLTIWEEKAIKSEFYKNAIYTWTELDVKKQLIAKENKLNYTVYYSEEDAYND